MADREIVNLPELEALTDETLIPVYQPGAQTPAQSMTGAQFREFAEEAAAEAADRAEAAADRAEAANVPPDWNQNDAIQPDYIKNRPMYRKLVPLLDGTYAAVDVGDGTGKCDISAGVLPIEAGKTYLVVFEGKEYTCEAYASSAFSGIINIGNEQVATGEGVEPFLLWTFQGVSDVLSTRVPGSYRLELYEQLEMKQLDDAYIPDTIARIDNIPAQVRPDWNQNNETAADYIKNKPFYRSVWLPMMELELIDQSTTDVSVWESYSFESYAADNPLRFTVDADYLVEYDGVNYSCKPFAYKTTFGVNRIAIGNPELLSVYDSVTIPEGVGADVPFAVAVDDFGPEGHGSGTLLTTTGGEHYAAIFALEKLPSEYLDMDGIKEAIGSTGAVQPDWNQNDSNAAGYIKNRPFYDDSVVILPETAVVLHDNGMNSGWISGTFDIVAGETYTITWNGISYKCVGNAADGEVYFVLDPAHISYLVGDGLEIFGKEAGTATISISRSSVVKLPDKYLDMTAEEWTFELEDGTTVTKQVMVK